MRDFPGNGDINQVDAEVCDECGAVDPEGPADHSNVCSLADAEPDWEQIVADRERGRW